MGCTCFDPPELNNHPYTGANIITEGANRFFNATTPNQGTVLTFHTNFRLKYKKFVLPTITNQEKKQLALQYINIGK